ncbi:protein STICHEL-like 3 [Telopea speciosissima]|uniref:protein STICHEL-like 3 n=1 Tax=Telopea speciosissima TaxID=54955 RepID=UPI001CC62098|nr:protein STICHEL-like 3 [Telopea speciosissima]
MTRPVRGRYFKDENGAISDHLRNHVHLTNCIHLRNHMHKQSPILTERSLIRDLIVLQRSRSLRDPSTSTPSWQSPSIADSLSKRLEKDGAIHEGRRSVRIEKRRREGRRLSGSSPPFASEVVPKAAAAEVRRGNTGGTVSSDRRSIGRVRDSRRIKDEKSSQKNRSDHVGGTEDTLQDAHNSVNDLVSGKAEPNAKKNLQKGKARQDVQLKTLSEQLNELPIDSDGVDSSLLHQHGRHRQQERTSEDLEASNHGYCSGLHQVRRRRSRGARKAWPATDPRDIGAHNELSVASNSLAQGSQPKYYMEEEEDEVSNLDGTRVPGHGCGIPWNWSRIHHRGKTFLDIAGRSLSCGLSDSRLKKGGSIPQRRDISDMPAASDHSSSSTKSDAEAVPLLVEPSGSQDSTDNSVWLREYSGELGIFGDHGLKHEVESDLASQARSGGRPDFRGHRHVRHQSLTQKYMPRTFKDLVGQNLVAQALSNAVVKRKVGLVYVFYGPHGTGKTSCARVFARALNCQSSEHPKPCGFCNSCIAHDLGKSRNVKELGPVGNFDFESIMDLIDNMIMSQLQSQYRVFIFDDCDNLPPDSWNAISKVIDRAPRRVVFILVSTCLDHLPHIIISRCQKFFFPKLKDADIIYTLQWIATQEDLEIDKDALKLIASRSDGSLRDAEMTLEQLSLLGQRITVPLVQELVGLVSDEKLVDLLDLALSADTVNTVKNLREIMEAGVEPLALMSQLATIITDILAGSYLFTKERLRRKFFRRSTLSKEDMEKLRQALKTLSEAEKQLRMSNDKLTWLTAALLQLAPDQQYVLPSSSGDTSFNHSPSVLNNNSRGDIARKSNIHHANTSNNETGLLTNIRMQLQNGSADDVVCDENKINSNSVGGKKQAERPPQRTFSLSTDITRGSGEQTSGKGHKEEIWLAVLEKIEPYALCQFMQQEGKLISVSFGAAPTIQLMFSSKLTKSKKERLRGKILQAFESVLGSPVTIEIRCEASTGLRAGAQVPLLLPAAGEGSSQMATDIMEMPKAGNDSSVKMVLKDRAVKAVGPSQAKPLQSDLCEMAKSEIVEIAASPRENECIEHMNNNAQLDEVGLESFWMGEEAFSRQQSLGSLQERRNRKIGAQAQSQSLVKRKVSLAHVIQQAEGCTQQSEWSRRKAISIAEKLEQENLRMEPKSRTLLCWKASSVTRGKLSRLKLKTRKSRSLLKLVSCGRCLSSRSPRVVFYGQQRPLEVLI